MSAVSSAVSSGSCPAVGSSSRSRAGFEARARAISSRRWSPYGRFLASSSPRPLSPTSASSSRARSRDATSSRRSRGVDSSASIQVVLSRVCMPDQDVLHRRHVREEPDVLERAAEAGDDHVVRPGAPEDPEPGQAALVGGRPGDAR